VQGEDDYARSVEIGADGTARAFAGSYVTRGETERRLSPAEREALLAALSDLPAPFGDGDGASLRHRLEVGDRAWTWRGGPDDVPDGLRPVVSLLARLSPTL
jgi:hypothetical protein